MNLSMNFDATADLSTQVLQLTNRFRDLLSQIEGENLKLQNFWAGTDSTAYTAKVAAQAKVMSELANTLQKMSQHIGTTAADYQDTQEKLKNMFN